MCGVEVCINRGAKKSVFVCKIDTNHGAFNRVGGDRTVAIVAGGFYTLHAQQYRIPPLRPSIRVLGGG
jgi:hypothetical protein